MSGWEPACDPAGGRRHPLTRGSVTPRGTPCVDPATPRGDATSPAHVAVVRVWSVGGHRVTPPAPPAGSQVQPRHRLAPGEERAATGAFPPRSVIPAFLPRPRDRRRACVSVLRLAPRGCLPRCSCPPLSSLTGAPLTTGLLTLPRASSTAALGPALPAPEPGRPGPLSP